MEHLLQSAPTHSLLLDAQLQIKDYQEIDQFFKILHSDIGNSVDKIPVRMLTPIALSERVQQVLHTATPTTRLVQNCNGEWYYMEIAPYLQLQQSQKGVLISFTPHKFSTVSNYKTCAQQKEHLKALQRSTKSTLSISKEGIFLKIIPEYSIHNIDNHKFFIGKHIAEVFPKNIFTSYTENIKKAIASGKTIDGCYEIWQPQNNHHFHTHFVPLNRHQALVITKEVTQQVNNKEAIAHFVRSLAHDFKQPIRTIDSFFHLLIQKPKAQFTTEQQEFTKHIKTNITSMQQLITNLTNYIKDKEPTFEVVHYSILLCEVLQNLQALITTRKANIQFERVPEKHIWMIRSDIRQLFQNLLENAIKFTPEQIRPVISIEAKELDNYWQFSVTDNGRGIAAKDIDKIFTPLVKKHLQNEQEGNGWGLAICKKIVQRHGGEIWALSNKEGQGTTFYFTLAKKMEK